jgi:hypothetical protein
MSYTQDIITMHPQTIPEPARTSLIDSIEACFSCAQTCITCADACTGEKNVEHLRTVIRNTNDSGDLCIAVGKNLSRLNNPNFTSIKNQILTCIEQVRITGINCSEHAMHHEHCRICAESCRKCENALLEYSKYTQ